MLVLLGKRRSIGGTANRNIGLQFRSGSLLTDSGDCSDWNSHLREQSSRLPERQPLQPGRESLHSSLLQPQAAAYSRHSPLSPFS
nr:hypothetical protein Iba_chr04aCG18330 [Ipomoea batatas]